MFQFIPEAVHNNKTNDNLKTSHVTVYLDGTDSYGSVFQFKNISCYSLSTTLPVIQSASPYLKTSHVTVYHAEQKQQYEMDKYLKTSHVTVYRNRSRETVKRIHI